MKYMYLLLLGFCFSLSAEDPIIDFDDIEQALPVLEQRASSFTIRIPKNSSIPLNLFVKGSVFKLEGVKNAKLKLQRSLYLQKRKSQLLFSFDKLEWKRLDQLLTGDFDFGIDLNARSGIGIKLGLEIDEK